MDDRLCGLEVRAFGYRSGGPAFDFRHYKKIVGLERGRLSLVSATEELLEWKGSCSSGIRHADHMAPSIHKKLVLASLTSGGRSVGIVRLRTEAMEISFFNVMKSRSVDMQHARESKNLKPTYL
jgi:hypothetical protein